MKVVYIVIRYSVLYGSDIQAVFEKEEDAEKYAIENENIHGGKYLITEQKVRESR